MTTSFMKRVHPDLRKGVNFPTMLFTKLGFRKLSLRPLRVVMEIASPRRPAPKPSWSEVWVPATAHDPDVRAFVVGAKKSEQLRPAVLFIHGGGYIAGSAFGNLKGAQEIAEAADCLVVAVEYRLAPEVPYPGPLEDCYAALHWMYTNAAELGIDRNRIALYGESAGGGLAASLALLARDRREVPLAAQILIYPMLDDRTGSSRPAAPGTGEYLWTAASNRFGWSSWLGVPAGAENVPSGAVPARTTDVSGLPPTFIGVGTLDLFFDENIQYAQRLRAAGTDVILDTVEGAYHGFEILAPEAPCSKRFKHAWQTVLRNAFRISAAQFS